MIAKMLERVGILLIVMAVTTPEPLASGPQPDTLKIDAPVVCRSIEGFEDYEVLPNAEQTSDEKLLIYFRPRGYKIVSKGKDFAAKFTQDVRIRELGKKKVLRSKENILEYEAVASTPPRTVYLSNSVSLKGLPPGDYEYDIILRDENEKGARADAVVKFRIVAAQTAKPEG